MDYFDEIVNEIIDGKINNPEELQKEKINLCKEYDRDKLPKNAEILERVDDRDDVSREEVLHVLQRKPTRTKSGVAVIAVMTEPAECPHGRCMMCPGGPEEDEPSPQSYTGEEPAALRGERNDYLPREQVEDRLKQYEAIGHTTDKIDMIIMGGTFPARDWNYQKDFVKGCLDGLNGTTSPGLEKAKERNEKADKRCIGLTVETRPDHCKEKELERMLELGVTRVEIGVQSIRDEILEEIDRGHSVEDSIEATRLAKEKGLKVCYHIMPGLPGMDNTKDLDDFLTLFKDQRFQPDMLKIYPTLVVEGTELYERWKDGEYEPLSTNKAAKLIAEMKAAVPKYVRIQRVQRDIPSPLVDGGVKKSNLRQYARKELKSKKADCDCIRCREGGHSKDNVDLSSLDLKKFVYEASGGVEHYLELSDPEGLLVGYARLRTDGRAVPTVRELKVVGEMTPVDENRREYQHSGFGSEMLKECEDLARERGDKLRITSGVGAREYYRKHGYELEKPYMVKEF
ncbi:MAG: tRNA uridine(34) 5-carboxymethylaminomethyl modification radical SAM/GNAT enzyme Elp3 [Candidatus Thermoplasmatota archaeon]|nr:tRNA uridine(34) 5-carboxymethylaminomethyl modification radical SAM/GNAT enzyme Elp3 [Candidatus Thermoplasmatota archaeon]